MSIQDIIDLFGSQPNFILSYYVVILVVAIIGYLFVNKNNFKAPLSYLYTLLIYGVSIPGLLSFMLLLYSFFFLKGNLLELDIVVYIVPIIGLITTLFIINKSVPMSYIPGFDKISGLFTIVIITFFITYLLQKMFFGVLFIGKVQHLIVLFLGLLIVLKLAFDKLKK